MAVLPFSGENVVSEQKDEAETGGPGSAPRLSVGPGRSAAASVVSAPRPEWTVPCQERLLPAAAAAAPRSGPPRPPAPAPLPPCHPASTLLLNSPKMFNQTSV